MEKSIVNKIVPMKFEETSTELRIIKPISIRVVMINSSKRRFSMASFLLSIVLIVFYYSYYFKLYFT